MRNFLTIVLIFIAIAAILLLYHKYTLDRGNVEIESFPSFITPGGLIQT